MFRLSVATDAKHLTDVSAKNIDNCIEQVKVGKNIFSVNMANYNYKLRICE